LFSAVVLFVYFHLQGQVFCCTASLAICGALDSVDGDKLGWWLAERQVACGGLNGRPEKLPDVCYSWWVLSSLAILRRLHWIDTEALSAWILQCQDEEKGGIADRYQRVACGCCSMQRFANTRLTRQFQARRLRGRLPHIFRPRWTVADGVRRNAGDLL
jgi:hypothetical protein